ncbi:hypothetical protein Cri9333_1114 [Crinalium epipsammum PCC 9333]|uniref:Pvc16 N-terminal domain-containing protein n=1 Tax=Crinalium epipsammum PCC 9333 TaxID=1173022 RepID=K9VVA3_9CYAN|nr:DUF4255 domain-containing protein [Crinalium epipsammum]AFZ12023.1 hypothetical protein Cri9333_1114 [Crinalium epipsammum PCC 9333]
MSNSLAIAAVTKTLRNLIAKGIADEIGSGSVTARPPDKARDNSDSGNQINIFLYQTLPNAAWRNQDLRNRVKPGETGQAPLALNLYYLITAYGQDNDDILSHRLLGTAMRVLHDHCILNPIEIKNALAESDLQNQIERVRINLVTLSLEELSKLWSCFQTQYRISTAYEVSVILIESDRPVKAPLPVLTRGSEDSGIIAQTNLTPSFPTLQAVELPDQQASVRLGEVLTLRGHHLNREDSKVYALFSHPSLAKPIRVELPAKTATELDIPLSDQAGIWSPGEEPSNWQIGIYNVAVQVIQDQNEQTSNALPFSFAPSIKLDNLDAERNLLTLTSQPPVKLGQRVVLLLGDRELIPEEIDPSGTSLVFKIRGISAGDYFVRLRVDGVDSLLVDRSATTPIFDQNNKVEIRT